ncbi:SDR family NAD(P)-dependent oxidoreductase [Actinophytocola sp.]|uniref:SDR family NAD(P)-dependent oxidoreductase n=1 Tax=Actinophytocola sp. TaxID=1872138 RepID=UPI0025BBCE2A|nr:SDR family NAD(P)-dependent oxidoreductase [Actinophytocola sp.]
MSHEQKPVLLVTGATSGVGHAVAADLAAHGARVLLGARSTGSGHAAASAIRSRTPGAELEVVAADLSDMKQVRSLAGQVRQHTTRLDGLVLNAGEVRTRRQLTPDGFETNFATNYLSGFLLTHLLLPLLTDSAPARIVVLSSSNHAHIKHLDLDALSAGTDFRHIRTYSTRKLLTVLFVAEFARRLHGTGVTANAADPGFVRTNLGRHTTGPFWLFLKLTRPFQASPAKAARTPVYLATAPEIATTTGGYFANSRPAKPSPLSQDPAIARKLWGLSGDLLTQRDLASSEELT